MFICAATLANSKMSSSFLFLHVSDCRFSSITPRFPRSFLSASSLFYTEESVFSHYSLDPKYLVSESSDSHIPKWVSGYVIINKLKSIWHCCLEQRRRTPRGATETSRRSPSECGKNTGVTVESRQPDARNATESVRGWELNSGCSGGRQQDFGCMVSILWSSSYATSFQDGFRRRQEERNRQTEREEETRRSNREKAMKTVREGNAKIGELVRLYRRLERDISEELWKYGLEVLRTVEEDHLYDDEQLEEQRNRLAEEHSRELKLAQKTVS